MWVVFQQRVVNYLISTDCLVHIQGVWYCISQKSSIEHQEKKRKRFTIQLLEEAAEIATESSLETEISGRI